MLTIVVPVYANPEIIKQFIKLNGELLTSYPLVVINKSGGEELSPLCQIYIESDMTFSEARKLSYNLVKTKYILNLDADNILPKGYVEDALKLLESNEKIYIVAIDYEYPHTLGHLGFGTSIGRVNILRLAYDWTNKTEPCECIYIWRKLRGRLATLPYQAKHLKEIKI